MKYFVGSVAVLGLAACGGGSSGPAFVTVQPKSESNVHNVTDLEPIPRTSLTRATINGARHTFDNLSSRSVGTFSGHENVGSTSGAMFESETDGSRAVLVGLDNSGDTTLGTTVARLTETNLPTSGTATFAGDYVAGVQPGSLTTSPRLLITGDATLTANFENDRISGMITNRRLLDNATMDPVAWATVDDLELQDAQIDPTGTYFGQLSEGSIVLLQGGNQRADRLDGTYQGVVAGQDATENVGAVSMEHEFQGLGTYYETGVFAAGH